MSHLWSFADGREVQEGLPCRPPSRHQFVGSIFYFSPTRKFQHCPTDMRNQPRSQDDAIAPGMSQRVDQYFKLHSELSLHVISNWQASISKDLPCRKVENTLQTFDLICVSASLLGIRCVILSTVSHSYGHEHAHALTFQPRPWAWTLPVP